MFEAKFNIQLRNNCALTQICYKTLITTVKFYYLTEFLIRNYSQNFLQFSPIGKKVIVFGTKEEVMEKIQKCCYIISYWDRSLGYDFPVLICTSNINLWKVFKKLCVFINPQSNWIILEILMFETVPILLRCTSNFCELIILWVNFAANRKLAKEIFKCIG